MHLPSLSSRLGFQMEDVIFWSNFLQVWTGFGVTAGNGDEFETEGQSLLDDGCNISENQRPSPGLLYPGMSRHDDR